ncbi:MAG: ABC transporter permease [Anaerolineae bacterium]|nr:MAG: ABC transporter permease [Anaerolineae bacterium]
MLWDVALRNLWHRRLRSLLTILGVAVAVQLYISMSSLIAFYEQDLGQQLSALAGKVYVQHTVTREGEPETFPSLSSNIPAPVAAQILSLDGLDRRASSGVLFAPLVRPPAPNLPPYVMAVGVEPGHEAAFLSGFEIESGLATLTEAHSVILGQGAAEHYGLAESAASLETIEIMKRSFTVVGVLEPAPRLFNGAVLMPLATAQELFARPDTLSAVILTAADAGAAPALQADVETRFPRLHASGQDDVAESANELLSNQLLFFQVINNTVVAVVIVVVAIVMVVAVMERRREIGTLRAIGARRRAILGLIVSESLTLVLVGAIVAWPVWALFRLILQDDVVATTGMFISSWLQMLVTALIAGVLASLWPAWQAMRVDPLQALQYE